ncbi:uncharacterized protein [Procambarus clarkii]|uniref:uncharacterized protein n=1 Tax=Procambarus clarkii TaxID=6728 RepID=UPI0037440D6D
MRLDHTPAALLPRPQVLATTGPSDPRRKPLVDLSNGDYSDLRKHLQDISASHRHHRHHHHPRARLPEYLQQFAPSHYFHHHHDTGLQSTVGGAGSCRLEPLGASASQADLKLDCRRHSRSSSRSRSSSASRSRPLAAENSSLLANTTVTSCSSSSRGAAEGQSQSMLQEGRGGRAPHAFKRHSIADVPTEASFRGVWETQKERRGRSCSRERGESSRNKSILSRLSRDKRKESRVEEREERSGRGREGRRASRERSREEPIYEKVGNGDTSSANTTSSSVSSKRSKATSGSSINSRKSLNSYDNAIYMSMRDLRAQCQQPKTERCVYEVEHLYSPLHPRISPDLSQTRVHTREHLYENMLYLPMTDVKSSTKKPQDRSRPLPEPPSFDHHDLDDTCDFTSEPQKDIHKPVAIKISNDLIARFGKSPNERQHPMPHYGLYIASQPSKMPCTGEGGKDSDPHKVVSDGSRGKVYRSTGQHVHINYSQGPCEPSVALHSLRPPPPPPPRQSKTSQYNNSSKTRHKPKGQPKPKSDSHLPIIYENTRQEEDLSQSAKKRKLRHTMEIEFSFDDEDITINRCSGNRCVSETSSRGGNISSSDNPDSGVSEGITTPLISPLSAPRSPETARSDSLLEESYTPLSLEELHPFRENGGLTLARENGDMSRNSTILSVSHDITDPRFLESFLRDKPHLRKKYEGQSSIITEASVDDFFNYTNTLSLQQTSSNISFSNLDNLYQNYVDCIETSRNNRNNDVSKLLLCAVGRNLFSESSHKVSTPNRDSSQHTNSISRRHSFAGVADISRRLSNIGFSDDTSLWGMDVSSNSESTLKRSKSLHCLSPSLVSQESSDVPLMDSMARILENPELWLHPCDYSVLLANGEQITGEQSEQWWEGREEEEEEGGRWATSGSGGVGVGRRGQPAHTGSLALSPASHHHLRQPIPAPHSPTLLLLPPTCNPTPALPVEMNGGKHVAAGHAGACHSVPLRSPSCEDTPQLDSSPCGSECCADLTVLPGACDLTARQRRRQEESTFRLQHMLRDCAQPLRANDSEDSVSADWSMEAVLNEVSTIDHQDLDAEISDPLDFPDSPDCQDVISLCTLDSDYADSIFISPKLCQKIQQVSEEKMLARLRKSFRGKKDKRSGNEVDKPKTTAPAKVGILMFVDNPMYLSPEVKKEAKIVSAQNNENSVWYVGNPMYNSPEPNKLRNVNYDIRQKVLCEKENLRNSRLAKVVCQSATNRKPLSSIWHQSNPCYESPDTKKLEVKLSNLKASSGNLDDTYLTPIPVKHPKNFVPRPTVVVPASLAADKDILDAQKFLDHEYCTIPGDESDSWVSQSTTSRRSESPSARRSLEFGANQSKTRGTRPLNTPSRMWRQTAKNQHSTPRKYQGTLEKNLNSGAPLGTRGLKTPRTVKRGKKSKDICQEEVRSSSSPPPLPARPHPLHRHYENDRSTSTVGFEDTNDFHHRGDLQDLHRRGLKDLDDTGEFQLPPDSMYESINSHQARGSCGLARSVSHASGYSRRLRQVLHPSGSSSVCSSPVPSSSRASRSRCSFSGTKNLLGGSLGEGSLKGRSRRTSTTKRVSKKYRARDVLQSKGQLKIAVYENFGLLTIHVMAARRLKSRLCSVCNPYVKISLVPDSEERTFCRTPLVRATNSPIFDQKFSFDFLAEDLDKRLLVSIWSRDTLRKRSEFLGCMSFSVAHISSKRVHGWFRLLTESLGRRKHFAVSFLNASHETTRTKMEEMVLLDDNTTPATGGVAVDDNKQMAVGARPSTQPPRGQTPYTITINVVRGSQAFGFSVAWTKPPRVERVEEGLPAHQAGLKPGDYIIFIGQYNVVKYEEEAVLQDHQLKGICPLECGDTLPLEVYRRGVSKHPRGLVNGYTSLPAPTDNEAHTRKRLSHITFNTEKVTADRQHTIYSLINCEQAFSNSCRFGLERYLIPLKFRSDLVTQTQHDVLFNNLDQKEEQWSHQLLERLGYTTLVQVLTERALDPRPLAGLSSLTKDD